MEEYIMKKKVMSALIVAIMLINFAIPTMAATTHRPVDNLAAATAFIDAYVDNMSSREIAEIGELTDDLLMLTFADGSVWGAPVYKIDTTDVLQAFSSDVPEGMYSVTFVADTTYAVLLSSQSSDSVTDRFHRIRLNMTTTFFRTPQNAQGQTSMRITNVSGGPTFLEQGVQITSGTVHVASTRPDNPASSGQNRTFSNVRGNFNFNTGFTVNVLSANGSVVGSSWRTQVTAR
jgi:hypothetical protein